ncbi:MAG TPA: hypothetical protein PKD46_17460 [Aggregatilineaceae bacterium]|nr:hypothetical protein [Aggregatilineaceae bacterium]
MTTPDAGAPGLYFTPAERQAALDRLLAALAADERIAGVILVGSGSVGFGDAYSDIDLDVVLRAAAEVAPAAADWDARVGALFEVWGRFAVEHAPDNLLRGFLLAGYLELDIAFVHLGNLVARRGRWRVAFDRSGQIEAIQQRTWAARPRPDARAIYDEALSSIWHYVLHVAVAARRGAPWRALHDLETVRRKAVELAGARYQLDVRRFRYADKLPPELLTALEDTLPASSNPGHILSALRAATICFFDQARALAADLRVPPPDALAERLLALIDAWR